jgi:hypothetical protein
MGMPGFTAMLSLERTTYRYVPRRARMVTQGVTGVVPSALLPTSTKCWFPCYTMIRAFVFALPGGGAIHQFGHHYGWLTNSTHHSHLDKISERCCRT